MQIHTWVYLHSVQIYTWVWVSVTFTHHVFEKFSSSECKVNLLTVCIFLLTELWLILVAASALILLQFFLSCFFFFLFFLHLYIAGFNFIEYLNQWKCLLPKCLLVILWFYQLFASYCHALYKPNLSLKGYISSVGDWLGRWCWVASSAGGGGPTALAYI